MDKSKQATTIVIGLCGYKQSGKDTAASYIRSTFSPATQFHRIAFADALKDEVCALFKATREDIEKDKEKWRHILQDYGQRAKETRGELVWVTEVSKRIQLLGEPKDRRVILITDCRFPFEANWIKELGGFLVKVERYDNTEDTHPSEVEVGKIRGFDYFLSNKGTLRDLERECRWLGAAIRDRYHV